MNKTKLESYLNKLFILFFFFISINYIISNSAFSNENELPKTKLQNECIKTLAKSSISINYSNSNEIRTKSIMINGRFDFDDYPDFDYSNFDKILFLSDNGKANNVRLKYSMTSKLILSSDFNSSSGVNIRLDNNKLPFAEQSFDLILMNRGLCHCTGSNCCAGIDSNKFAMKKFLKTVINLLDSSNSQSMAILTGFYFKSEKQFVPGLWIEIIEELSEEFPQFQFGTLRDQPENLSLPDGFVGIIIGSANSNESLEQRLENLRNKNP